MGAATWKLKAGATWRQKLEAEHPNHGKVVPVPERMRNTIGRGKMLIPRPLDVDRLMRRPKKGQLIRPSQIRAELAREAGVAATCPLTTGIFVRIAAEAAEEARRAGRKRITPYWRTIRDDGKLNDKFPGGAKAQAARLRREGFTILPGRGGQPPRIDGFEHFLVET